MSENAILDRLQKIDSRLESIEGRLFIGNGNPSFAVRLDRLEIQGEKKRTNNFLVWSTILAIAATIIGEHVATRFDKSNATPQSITAGAKQP